MFAWFTFQLLPFFVGYTKHVNISTVGDSSLLPCKYLTQKWKWILIFQQGFELIRKIRNTHLKYVAWDNDIMFLKWIQNRARSYWPKQHDKCHLDVCILVKTNKQTHTGGGNDWLCNVSFCCCLSGQAAWIQSPSSRQLTALLQPVTEGAQRSEVKVSGMRCFINRDKPWHKMFWEGFNFTTCDIFPLL